MIKQKHFNLKQIKTPAILNYGMDDNGVFYFDMEFVSGITLSKYMHQIKIKEIADLMDTLFQSLRIHESSVNPHAQAVFQSKIASLKQVCDAEDPRLQQAFTILEAFDFSSVPASHCCGDLTLENILLSASGIYIIDLLDSFYNSWMIDVAKILQDVDLGWSYRHIRRDFNLNLRLAAAKQALYDCMQALPDGAAMLRSIYHILLLNVLRIYPYAKDDTTEAWLGQAVSSVITTINELEETI